MPVIRQKWITRADLRANIDTLYVFGDNMAHTGFGGQAREMRGEPNAVGVPTKWVGSMAEDAFFKNEDVHNIEVLHALSDAFLKIENHLHSRKNVVIPIDGLGTGLSRLAEKAPEVLRIIDECIAEMERIYGKVDL